jgi:hypothetical protein
LRDGRTATVGEWVLLAHDDAGLTRWTCKTSPAAQSGFATGRAICCCDGRGGELSRRCRPGPRRCSGLARGGQRERTRGER